MPNIELQHLSFSNMFSYGDGNKIEGASKGNSKKYTCNTNKNTWIKIQSKN